MTDLKKSILDSLKIKSLNDLTEEYLNVLKKHIDSNEKKKELLTPNTAIIDKNSKKYILLLKLINLVFTNLKKAKIKDLKEFIKVKREELINPVHLPGLRKISDEIFKEYSKGVYMASVRPSKSIMINTIRNMCKELGIKYVIEQYHNQANSIVKTLYTYSII